MALKRAQKPKRVAEMRDYWGIYRREAILASVLMQLLATLVVGGALVVAGARVDTFPFLITISATFLVSVPLNLFLVLFLLTPLRDLATSIAHAAGQKVDEPLQNPNLTRYESNGFHDLLLYVYENEDVDANNSKSSQNAQHHKALLTALNQTNTGIVIMNTAREITYANRWLDRKSVV